MGNQAHFKRLHRIDLRVEREHRKGAGMAEDARQQPGEPRVRGQA